jgi:hypothetical protein
MVHASDGFRSPLPATVSDEFKIRMAATVAQKLADFNSPSSVVFFHLPFALPAVILKIL